MRRELGVAAAAVVLIASGCGSSPEQAPATVTVTSSTSSPQGTTAPALPSTSAAEAPAGLTIVEESDGQREALMKERERLLDRLVEIDKELGGSLTEAT